MRGASAATFATVVVLGLVGCKEEVTAIKLVVVPDDTTRVRQADHLELYVGYGMELVPRAIQVHLDDGQLTTYDIGSFIEPIEIYLTDDGSTAPFWVGVRAVVKGTGQTVVVGEGGYPTPLEFEPGVVLERRIDVKPASDPNNTRLPEVWDVCPGWTDEDGTRHHIVVDVNGADCDGDGYAYEQGANDCDDFDDTFNPNAVDTVCDHVDHTCGQNTFIGQDDRCVGPTDPMACILGTTQCVDNEAPPQSCQGPGTLLPPNVCTACSMLVGSALNECIKNSASVNVTCHLYRDTSDFCQTEPIPLSQRPSWWLNAGGFSMGGSARWVRIGIDSPLHYGWVQGAESGMPMLNMGLVTDETPPSPAMYLLGADVTLLGGFFQDTNVVVTTDQMDGPVLYRVDVEVELAPDCMSVPASGCPSWPISN